MRKRLRKPRTCAADTHLPRRLGRPTSFCRPCAQDVLNVFNPYVIIPAIFTSIFTYVGSGLALKDVSHPPSPLPTPKSSAPSVNPPPSSLPPLLQPLKFSCAANGMFITGSVFCFVTFVLYAIATWVLLIYANVVIAAIETVWGAGYWFDDCLDESRAMFSSAGVGCLIATIGALGAFVSSICASCRRMLEVPSQPPCRSSLPPPPGADVPGSSLGCAVHSREPHIMLSSAI